MRTRCPVFISNVSLSISLFVIACMLSFQARSKVRDTPCLFIWGGLFAVLFILFPLLLNIFSGYAIGIKGNVIQDESVYIIYALMVLVSVLIYTVAVVYRSPREPLRKTDGRSRCDAGQHYRSAPQIERFVYFASGLLVPVGLLVFVFGTGMSLLELAVASRFEWFARGTVDRFWLNIGLYLMGLVAVFSYYDVKFGMPKRWLSILVYGSVITMIFLAGGRKWLLFCGSGALAGYFDRKGGVMLINRRLIISIALIGFLVIAWQFGRTVSWQKVESFDQVGEEFVNRVPHLLREGDATYFYRASLDSIRLNKDHGLIYPLAVVRRIIFLPFPDDWTMGLKPEGIPFLVAEELNTGTRARRGNQPPGLIGLFVLSFGWAASLIALPMFTVVLVRALDRYVCRNDGLVRNVIWATYSIAIMLLMRGSTGGVYFLVFNLIAVISMFVGYSMLRDIVKPARKAQVFRQ